MAKREATPSDYDVGYGKPPQSTQFKTGVSGNPKGRPKGHSSFQSLLEKQLYKTMKIRVDGKEKNIALLEIGVMKLVNALVKSDPDKMIAILKFVLPNLTTEQGCAQCEYIRQLTDEEIEKQISQHLINDIKLLSNEQKDVLLAQLNKADG